MIDSTRICKICGKEYPYCKTAINNNIFRWQDVACCPEHGSEYFARVEEARANTSVVEDPEIVSESLDDEDEDLYPTPESFDDSDDDMDFYYDDDEDEDTEI